MFIVVPFLHSTGLAIVAEADLRFGDFLSENSYRYKYTAIIFWVVNGLMRCGYACWQFLVVLSF